MKIDTFLPIFPGFYNTIFDEGDSFVEYETECISEWREYYPELADVPEEFIRSEFWDCVDYRSGNLAVVQNCCDAVSKLLSDYVESVTFQALKSPREYNFYNDSVDVEIAPKAEAISAFIHENWEAFSDYIKRRYTSRSGFMSFHPNNAEEWKEDTSDFSDFSKNGHILGSILEFIAEENGIDEWELYNAANVSEAFSNAAGIDTARLAEKWQEQKEAA